MTSSSPVNKLNDGSVREIISSMISAGGPGKYFKLGESNFGNEIIHLFYDNRQLQNND
jgi:hypothetical protein